jgi:hypothetical protein
LEGANVHLELGKVDLEDLIVNLERVSIRLELKNDDLVDFQ